MKLIFKNHFAVFLMCCFMVERSQSCVLPFRCKESHNTEAYLPCSLALLRIQALYYWDKYHLVLKVGTSWTQLVDHPNMPPYMYIHVCTGTYTYVHIHTRPYTYTHIHVHTCKKMYIHVHKCMVAILLN